MPCGSLARINSCDLSSPITGKWRGFIVIALPARIPSLVTCGALNKEEFCQQQSRWGWLYTGPRNSSVIPFLRIIGKLSDGPSVKCLVIMVAVANTCMVLAVGTTLSHPRRAGNTQ